MAMKIWNSTWTSNPYVWLSFISDKRHGVYNGGYYEIEFILTRIEEAMEYRGG